MPNYVKYLEDIASENGKLIYCNDGNQCKYCWATGWNHHVVFHESDCIVTWAQSILDARTKLRK